MKCALVLLSWFGAVVTFAQPSTEVYLFDLQQSGGKYTVANPQNVSKNDGYDNQPSFSGNGSYLYYTSWQSNDQTDIIRYNLNTGEKTKISDSDGSEYSPIEMPKGKSVSTIILERSGEQLLWQYDIKAGERFVLIPELVIGYHCWFDKKTVFSFVLGAPPTLQQINVKSGVATVIDEKIGRSLHKIPNEKAISYISKAQGEWRILRYEPKSQSTSLIGKTLQGSEDLCWTPTGTVIMGQGDKLFTLKNEQEWELIADFSNFGLTGITRLATNPAGNKLAVVVNE